MSSFPTLLSKKLRRQRIVLALHISRKPCASLSLLKFTAVDLITARSVSALVVLLTDKEDGKEADFKTIIRGQIETLRKQLDKSTLAYPVAPSPPFTSTNPYLSRMPPTAPHAASQSRRQAPSERDIRSLFDLIGQSLHERSTGPVLPPNTTDKDARALFDRL